MAQGCLAALQIGAAGQGPPTVLWAASNRPTPNCTDLDTSGRGHLRQRQRVRPVRPSCSRADSVRSDAAMRRPVWLLSMDTDHFCAPPLTTGALKAYFAAHGATRADTDVELVHFANRDVLDTWLQSEWPRHVRPLAAAAVDAGVEPVLGLSCYTWNVAELLEVARRIKSELPGMLVVAGGPHVQRAADFLHDEAIDVISLGEGERTFTELLDCGKRADWHTVDGLAFLDGGTLHETRPRARTMALDELPSAIGVVPLRDEKGAPLYRQVAYETSRGCPYRCSFCEWGTGAIGTKMFQFSLDRIRRDLEALIEGGVEDIWFSDSNFGALREDIEKARIIVDLKQRTGRPRTFASSWSKNHNARVQEVVRLLHRHGLLWHYHLALQTLTPRALELSNRTNMRANDYEPIVRSLAAEGVPVTAELIWGLPGDNLADFAANLDHLFSVFPNINIFAYTLLPGTEFYDRRDEYQIVATPVAGYGKAKGEYVVGCLTFPREEGEDGYVLVASHVILSRGHVIPYTLRLLALDRRASVSTLMRAVLRDLIQEYAADLPESVSRERMAVYENRCAIYLALLSDPERTWRCIELAVARHLAERDATDLWPRVARLLALDRLLCPRTGPATTIVQDLDFAADRVLNALGAMTMPDDEDFEGDRVELEIAHPGEAGVVLIDPDGGSWMRGRVRAATRAGARTDAPIAWLAEQGSAARQGGDTAPLEPHP